MEEASTILAVGHLRCGLIWVFHHQGWVATLVEIAIGPPHAGIGRAKAAEAGRVKEGPGSSGN